MSRRHQDRSHAAGVRWRSVRAVADSSPAQGRVITSSSSIRTSNSSIVGLPVRRSALANGEGVILVPTAAHWEEFKPRLGRRCRHRSRNNCGQLTIVDADALLRSSCVMPCPMPLYPWARR